MSDKLEFEYDESEYRVYDEISDKKLVEEDFSVTQNVKIELVQDFNAVPEEFSLKLKEELSSSCSESDSEDAPSPPPKTKGRNPPKSFKTCSICGYTARTKYHFERHLKTHFKSNTLKCNICREPMVSKIELSKHKETHRSPDDKTKFKCNLCDYVSDKSANVGQHADKHYREPVECLKCPNCNFMTASKVSMKKHKKIHNSVHTSKKLHCSLCSRTFSSRELKREHDLKTHQSKEDPNKFQCRKCPHTSATMKNLKEHNRIHKTENEIDMFQCSHCPYRSRTKNAFKNHVAGQHANLEEIRDYKCDFCPYKAWRGSHLTSHMRIKHKNQNVLKKCSLCKYRTVSQILIRKHFGVHSKTPEINFLCLFCEFECETIDILNEHVLVEHANDNKEIVNFNWRQKGEDSETVGDEPNYSCELVKVDNASSEVAIFCCQFKGCDFSSAMELYTSIHNTICHGKKGEVHKCMLCDYQNISRHQFLEHFRKHEIEIDHLKPHFCEICGSTWIRQSDLSRHMLTHWNGEDQEKKLAKFDDETK